ncbi:tigger transposable element-derived protein 6-like [Littorina saxatilis]|uniref:tigger transposable element-derived protein 6-like n=1 Tax=Littorina saxatilis TaxID=31220 RepID=UPI0038B427E4
MTSVIFKQWANKLNNKVRIQGRKILVFIDNCSAHPPMQLSNVSFVMLPPNTTSRLQPLDAGIIQNVKLLYRKSLLRHILFEMEKDATSTGPTLAKSVNLLHAVMWLKKAWQEVRVSTITKCFKKCGFSADDTTSTDPEEPEAESDEVDAAVLLGEMTWEEFASVDDDAPVCPEVDPDLPTISDSQPSASEVQQEEEEEEEEEDEEDNPVMNFASAASCTQYLMRFALANNFPDMADVLLNFDSQIKKEHLKRKSQASQTSMKSFFKPV